MGMNNINLHIFQARSGSPEQGWCLHITVDGKKVHHPRCDRTYASAADAITSARHAVKDLSNPSH